ncbi:MAG: pitrilysin family protein [Candidatus Paceibacterota bacterium]
MWDPYAEFQSAMLSNGLTIHAAHWPGRPWEAMGFVIHSGAECDPVGLEGLSHFVEHAVSENTTASRKEIRGFFDDSGGMVSLGATSYPYTYYRFFAPTNKATLSRAFSIFGHMLLSAKLQKCIERERQVIIGEFNRAYQFKFDLDLAVREHKALYAGYWLERFVCPIGNPESVDRITESDLQSHYDAHYTPANMSVVGVGGMQLSELVELLSKSPFAMKKQGSRTPFPTPATDVDPPSETRHVFEASRYITTRMEVGRYRSVAKIPGNINGRVIRLVNEMFNEVLDDEVRERRAWAYDIECSRSNFRHFYQFSIDCDALALKAIDDIEKVIEDCIASMTDRKNLFDQVKHRALASNFMIDPTGRGVCDGVLDDLVRDQRIMTLSEIGNDLERATMDDIRSVLQWLRPGQRWTLITRP